MQRENTEEYLAFMLGNLDGFDPADRLAPTDMLPLDRWAVNRAAALLVAGKVGDLGLLGVELLLAQGNVGLCSDFCRITFRCVASDVLQICEIRDGFVLGFVSHYAVTLFLRFMEATSSTAGFCPS